MRWETRRAAGRARELHERSAALVAGTAEDPSGVGLRPVAVVQSFSDSALVLGSAQPESTIDVAACAAAGVDVVRRRSGGGAVLVEPPSIIWVDLVIGTTDPLWCADVGRSAWWLGEAWAGALRRAGLAELDVWKGPMERNAWSPLICFASLGPGEVVDARRRKLVGISQRRTRHGALFQCACLLRWQPERLLDLLALSAGDRQSGARELAAAGAGVGANRAKAVLEGLLAALP
jgi:lipoate---protein ligase